MHERCLATTLVPSLPATPGLAAGFIAAMRLAAPRRVKLAAVESRLRSRSGLLALWLVTTAAVALVTLLMWRAGVPGWDDAAHDYKVYLLRHGGSVFWDTYWYGGGYGAITYGFVFYWLAQYVPGSLIVIVAAGTVPLSFYVYVRDLWKIDDVWPAWGMALVMALYLAHGQDPFVLALALTLAGLALIARRHPVWAALPVAVGIFSNPMGLVIVVPFVLTDLICRPAARRRYLVFFAAVAPAVVARFLLGWTFSEPGDYLNETSQLMVYLGFALVGVGLAGINAAHPRRPFVVLFLVYAALCVGSFVTPGSPLGNNIGRFFMVFGLPLLLMLRHTRLRRPFRYGDLAIVPIVAFALLQFGTRDQPLPERGRAPADHARLLRAGPVGGAGALRPRLQVPRGGPAPPLGGAVLPGGRLPDHARLVPPGRRHPQRAVLHALRRGGVRGLAAEHGGAVHLPAGGRAAGPVEQAGGQAAGRLPGVLVRRADRGLAHLPPRRRAAAAGAGAAGARVRHRLHPERRAPAHRLHRVTGRAPTGSSSRRRPTGSSRAGRARSRRGPTASWT